MGSDRKSPTAFRTISEVAEELAVPQHVLRFWESKFAQVKPVKRGGGRRYYRPEDVALLRRIQSLLYDDKFTIKGVQKLLREQGVKAVVGAEAPAVELALAPARPPAPEPGPADAPSSPGPAPRRAEELRAVLRELESIHALLREPLRPAG